MQAWAVTQGASGKGHRTDGGNIQKDEPSSRKNAHALSSSSGCNEAKLAFLEDDWDSLAAEQRADGLEVSRADRVGFLEPSCPGSLDASREGAHSQSSEFEDSADSAFLNETYSIHYFESERKNESLTQSPSELECEVQSAAGACFDVLGHHSRKVIGWERACEISDGGYGETAGAAQQRELDEDSQQEYHSAEEQEDASGPAPPDRTRTSHTPDLGLVGPRNSGREVECARCLDSSQVKLASESTIFLDSVDVYGQEDAPRGSKFQGSVVVREYHEPEQEVCKEQETSLMYHTVFDDLVLGSSPLENQGSRSQNSFVNPQKALEAKMYTGKVKCQRIGSEEFCGHEVVEKDASHHLGNPTTLRQDRALQMARQPRKDGQPPWTSVFDESVISACGCSHYASLQRTPGPASGLSAPAPSTAVGAPEAVGDLSLEASAGGTAGDTSGRSTLGAHPELAMRPASGTVTVAQTVDVCADFRARFTTSRATSAGPSVASTSTNTDVTAADGRWPGDWQGAGRRSVACNTEGPRGREPGHAPGARSSRPPGRPLSDGRSQPHGDFLSEDPLELRKISAITDLKKHPEREHMLSNEMEMSLPSRCCKQIMQRAVRAELRLLDLHYLMCWHHCRDIYRLITDSREGLNRTLPSNSKKELGSALLSMMGDLKVRYESLKDRINQGRPLEELLPLSLESKLLSAFSTLVSTLMKETPNVFSGADSELDHQSTCDIDISSSLKKALSQLALGTTLEGCDWLEGTSCPDQTDAKSMSSLRDRSPPEQDTLPKEPDGLKTGDIDVDFSQLKLDDQGHRNDREVSENWFDAKENLTGLDLSGIPENQVEKDGGDPKFTRDLKTTEPLRKDRGYLIHVGGLCPSVSEADLRSHFQKYHISEISIYDSTNYRYASLALKKNIDAKMAVKEMNGKEINGKPVKVRLVKTPGEHTLSLSYKSGMERSSGREVGSPASVSRLPRTRPRQLGPGQDHEGVKKNCKQIESTQLLPDTPVQFIPPNTLNLSSFTKIMKRLAELHPGVSRDCILDALQDVRANHKGFLNGLSINTIVEMTSSVLKNSDSS